MNTCNVEGCIRTDLKGMGMCTMHYQRWKAHGHTNRTQTPKGLALQHAVEYSVYSAIKTRCYNVRSVPYPNYGGRGIKMSDRWLGPDGFINFLKDMGPRPGEEYSIDRINNDGNYTPENCRWATTKEQANNKRSNKKYVYQGVEYTEAQLASKFGMLRNTLHRRLKAGYSVEDAVTRPLQKKRDSLYYMAKEHGISRLAVYKRLQLGWSLEDALNTPQGAGRKKSD